MLCLLWPLQLYIVDLCYWQVKKPDSHFFFSPQGIIINVYRRIVDTTWRNVAAINLQRNNMLWKCYFSFVCLSVCPASFRADWVCISRREVNESHPFLDIKYHKIYCYIQTRNKLVQLYVHLQCIRLYKSSCTLPWCCCSWRSRGSCENLSRIHQYLKLR